MNGNELKLKMKNITKTFPGVLALEKVNFELKKGEVHVLIGENGAGKSTLMKVLTGVYQPDEGFIEINGQNVKINSPREAQNHKISTIYQEFNLIPHLTVSQNIFLGREPKKGFLIDWDKMHNDAEKILRDLRGNINTYSEICQLSVSEQQIVEIAKALSINAEILVMDEPTAALGNMEIKALFKIIDKLKNIGVSIIYISHRLEEIHYVGDRVTVLRDGHYIATNDLNNIGIDDLIKMMVGRELRKKFPKINLKKQTQVEALRVEGLSNDKIKDVSFFVNKGEIIGFSGIVGSGRTEVARALFGIDHIDSGGVYLFSNKVNIDSPSKAINLGLALIPEDRKNQGLCLKRSVRENITQAAYWLLFPTGLIGYKKERSICKKYIADFKIATPSIESLAMYLSGGNQQKTVLAKWLCTKAKIFIFDEPTRGIDVGAKVEIYELINELIKGDAAVIIISSELPEVLGMCDRIYVMRDGKIKAEIPREKANQEIILEYAAGREKGETK